MSVNGIEGDGAIQNYFNQGMFEEMSYQTSALTAEVPSAGVRLNMIPKDGSNSLKGTLFYSQTPASFQSDNLTPDLVARGLKAPNRVEKILDVNAGVGGPGEEEQAVVLQLGARLGRRSDGHRLLPQQRPHAQDVQAGLHSADGRRQPHQERRGSPDLSGVEPAQVRRLRRRHHQVPRPRVRDQHVPDRRSLRHSQSETVLHRAVQVHRHAHEQPAGGGGLVGKR